MKKLLLYPIGTTAACRFAVDFLKKENFSVIDHPTPEVTHLLLDVPSFRPDGILRGGQSLEGYLQMLPEEITVVGGNLTHPALSKVKCIDLLKDPAYLCENAAITADCALQVAAPLLSTTLQQSPALVIGWGRIGKCLAQLLRAIGNDVTVAARKETDRATLRSLGYATADTKALSHLLPGFRLIFNTAPQPVIPREILSQCDPCVKIDLASKPGIIGEDVVWARGLPGIHAPESSGKLIAETLIRLIKEES